MKAKKTYSLSKLDAQACLDANLSVEQVSTSLESVRDSLKFGSEFQGIIGHFWVVPLLSAMLEVNIEVNHESYAIQQDDTLLIAQYSGPLLEEGATELPEGASIVFWALRIR